MRNGTILTLNIIANRKLYTISFQMAYNVALCTMGTLNFSNDAFFSLASRLYADILLFCWRWCWNLVLVICSSTAVSLYSADSYQCSPPYLLFVLLLYVDMFIAVWFLITVRQNLDITWLAKFDGYYRRRSRSARFEFSSRPNCVRFLNSNLRQNFVARIWFPIWNLWISSLLSNWIKMFNSGSVYKHRHCTRVHYT